MIGKSQGLSFCHVVSFFDFLADSSLEASPIHSNSLFLARRKLMNSNICEQVMCVPLRAFNACMGVCAWSTQGERLSVCAQKEATLSWLLQISLPHSSTERGSQEGERERERLRDNGNGG